MMFEWQVLRGSRSPPLCFSPCRSNRYKGQPTDIGGIYVQDGNGGGLGFGYRLAGAIPGERVLLADQKYQF